MQRQIYAYSFRPYQLVRYKNKKVVEIEISTRKSSAKAGVVIEEKPDSKKVSAIDFDITLFFDKLDELLIELPNFTVVDLKRALKHICGINDQNDLGWSAIIVAAYHGRLDLIKFLLENGANINDRNFKGTTVLMYAKDFCLKTKNGELFNYLLSQGADISLCDYNGKTVLDYLPSNQSDILGL